MGSSSSFSTGGSSLCHSPPLQSNTLYFLSSSSLMKEPPLPPASSNGVSPALASGISPLFLHPLFHLPGRREEGKLRANSQGGFAKSRELNCRLGWLWRTFFKHLKSLQRTCFPLQGDLCFLTSTSSEMSPFTGISQYYN